MVLSADDRDGLRQYLLGQTAEDQLENVEKRLLTDDGFFEELEIAEDELIDEYLTNELTPDQRPRFEQFFLISPERPGKLKFARALQRHTSVARVPSPIDLNWSERIRLAWNSQSRLIRVATVAAAVIIVVGAVWFARPRFYSPQTFATHTLTISSSNRGEGEQATKVKLPLSADRLKLQLKLPGPSSPSIRYRVELLSANETKALEPVSQDEDSVVVELPAAQLARGQYALKVFVIKPDGSEQPIRGSYLLTVE